jgi:hypothetical protein
MGCGPSKEAATLNNHVVHGGAPPSTATAATAAATSTVNHVTNSSSSNNNNYNRKEAPNAHTSSPPTANVNVKVNANVNVKVNAAEQHPTQPHFQAQTQAQQPQLPQAPTTTGSQVPLKSGDGDGESEKVTRVSDDADYVDSDESIKSFGVPSDADDDNMQDPNPNPTSNTELAARSFHTSITGSHNFMVEDSQKGLHVVDVNANVSGSGSGGGGDHPAGAGHTTTHHHHHHMNAAQTQRRNSLADGPLPPSSSTSQLHLLPTNAANVNANNANNNANNASANAPGGNPKSLVKRLSSVIGLEAMIEERREAGELTTNVVRIEVPFGKPIEAVYEGVHDGRILGSGISGLVRLVTHKATGVLYAVKCLDLGLIQTEEGLHQLREEIFIMCQLDHPNIVRLEEVYESHK